MVERPKSKDAGAERLRTWSPGRFCRTDSGRAPQSPGLPPTLLITGGKINPTLLLTFLLFQVSVIQFLMKTEPFLTVLPTRSYV